MRLALPGQANGRSYGALIERIRVLAADTLPADATVAVVSKGDEELLKLPGRRGWHFPESAPGVYAGHHPADGRDAVARLEEAIARGAQYLLLPATAFWWLEHYPELRTHLEMHHRVAAYDEAACLVFALGAYAGTQKVLPPDRAAVSPPIDSRRAIAPAAAGPPPAPGARHPASAADADGERYRLAEGYRPTHTLEQIREYVLHHDWAVDFMFEVLPPVFDLHGMRVLDLGCGITLPALDLIERHRVAEYHAIDPDPDTFYGGHNNYDAGVPYKQSLTRYYPGRVNYYRSVAERMPFPDGHFDFAFALQTTEHVQDIFATCREVRRVLKPGGYFLARHHNFYSWCGHHQGPYFVKDLPNLTAEQAQFQDWRHIDMRRDWREPHHLNCITLKELDEAFRASFRVVTWQNLYTRPDRGLTFLTPDILARYAGRFEYEDLATTGVLVVAKNSTASAAAVDRS